MNRLRQAVDDMQKKKVRKMRQIYFVVFKMILFTQERQKLTKILVYKQ
jgi:hypothetical protein